MKMNFVLHISILILFFLDSLPAETYYVSPLGSNEDSGSFEAPFLTIQKAHDAVQAGDTISDSGMLGPRQADGSLPQIYFLQLADGSDLIDAGTDVGFAYLGNAPDIGAFEFADETTYLAGAETGLMPGQFDLASFPNPFNPAATIRYTLPENSKVNLSIYDISWRRIIQLASGYRTAGIHAVIWNAQDLYGRQISSGPYFLRIQTQNQVKAIKLTYLK
jgi:hypothetical protein